MPDLLKFSENFHDRNMVVTKHEKHIKTNEYTLHVAVINTLGKFVRLSEWQ